MGIDNIIVNQEVKNFLEKSDDVMGSILINRDFIVHEKIEFYHSIATYNKEKKYQKIKKVFL